MTTPTDKLTNKHVIRICFMPTFWDENGVKIEVFQDAFTERGLSVYVDELISRDDLNSCQKELINKKSGRWKAPYLRGSVNKIRQLKDNDNNPLFSIKQTPSDTVGGYAHADITTNRIYASKAIYRPYRKILRDCFDTLPE